MHILIDWFTNTQGLFGKFSLTLFSSLQLKILQEQVAEKEKKIQVALYL